MQRIVARCPRLRLVMARDGAEGLRLAARDHPSLILLDLNLPDINGEEVMRRLGAEDQMRGIPVFVVSADATPTRIEQVLSQGASGHLTKPLQIGELLGVFEQRLRR